MKTAILPTSICFAFILFFSASALAQVDVNSGNYFVSHCGLDENTKLECTMQLAGIFQGIEAQAEFSYQNPKFCLPPRVTYGQEIAVILKFLRENPDKRNLPIGLLSYGALVKAFPCSSAPNTSKTEPKQVP